MKNWNSFVAREMTWTVVHLSLLRREGKAGRERESLWQNKMSTVQRCVREGRRKGGRYGLLV